MNIILISGDSQAHQQTKNRSSRNSVRIIFLMIWAKCLNLESESWIHDFHMVNNLGVLNCSVNLWTSSFIWWWTESEQIALILKVKVALWTSYGEEFRWTELPEWVCQITARCIFPSFCSNHLSWLSPNFLPHIFLDFAAIVFCCVQASTSI